jgi:hypothetical protein
MTGSFLLVRRQALNASEPFWSPPTRHVTQAFLLPLAAGLMISVGVYMNIGSIAEATEGLPLLWIILYGCAFHAAGFFMPRGMKLFGWTFVIGGSVLFAMGEPAWASPHEYGHGIMGFFFGALHLAYGAYLHFTERHSTEP